MHQGSEKTDWSKKHLRDMLVYQREYMWHEDTLEMLAKRLGVRHRMTAVELVRRKSLDDMVFEIEMQMRQEEFIAGGGDIGEFTRYREIVQPANNAPRQQMEAGEYSACLSSNLYVIRGTKPEKSQQLGGQS